MDLPTTVKDKATRTSLEYLAEQIELLRKKPEEEEEQAAGDEIDENNTIIYAGSGAPDYDLLLNDVPLLDWDERLAFYGGEGIILNATTGNYGVDLKEIALQFEVDTDWLADQIPEPSEPFLDKHLFLKKPSSQTYTDMAGPAVINWGENTGLGVTADPMAMFDSGTPSYITFTEPGVYDVNLRLFCVLAGQPVNTTGNPGSDWVDTVTTRLYNAAHSATDADQGGTDIQLHSLNLTNYTFPQFHREVNQHIVIIEDDGSHSAGMVGSILEFYYDHQAGVNISIKTDSTERSFLTINKIGSI